MSDQKFAEDVLLDHLPKEAILKRYGRAPGNELRTKFTSPESSAALAANAFGIFLDPAIAMPPPPAWSGTWRHPKVLLEEEVRFPWRGGTHPWLDAVVETDALLVGIESKRYEPFRPDARVADFSEAYGRPVWGEQMGRFERVRDSLASNPKAFLHLDAAQLVKHAFGLRTQGERLRKHPVLMYLFAEPTAWPDGRPIPGASIEKHRAEIQQFSAAVEGAEVEFQACSYGDLLRAWTESGDTRLGEHVEALLGRFDIVRKWCCRSEELGSDENGNDEAGEKQ